MLPFAWWGVKKGSVTQYLTDELVAAATRQLIVDRFITKAASAAFGETLDRFTSSRITAAKTLSSGLGVAATTGMVIHRFLTKAASATFADSLARSSASRATAARTLDSGLTAAAASSLSRSRTIVKSASAVFSDSLAQSSESALPAAPSGLTANESIGPPPGVDLAWTDNADDEDNYAVQRRDLNGSWGSWNNLTTTLPANTIEYTDTMVGPGETYEYRVYATNSRGSSGFSNVVQITPSGDP